MQRILSTIAAAIGLTGAASAQQHFTISSVDIVAPADWSEVKKEEGRITLRSADGRQQATVSIMRFGADASFDDFKRLCQLRLEAEKKDSPDCFVQAEPPFDIESKFGMFYSGGVKKTGRVFSGYLSLTKRELVTVYLEGLSTAPKEHLQTFQSFVESLTRK
ncbi:MAG: hypothetical protein V4773_01965 [Verrucomicrobiota bacterium]